MLRCVTLYCSVLTRIELTSELDGILRQTQCIAVCYSVVQCVAVCCSVLHCVALYCSVLVRKWSSRVSLIVSYGKHNVLQCVAVRCSVLQCVAACCSVLQCVVVCCIANGAQR